jgi:ADP-heptose:LPS heptosyltransferase
LTRALLTWLARIPYRAGFRTKGRGFLLTDSVRVPSGGLHDADSYLYLLKSLGYSCELGTPYEFYYSNGDEIRMLRMLQKFNIQKNNFLIFHTGANWEPKRWSSKRFLALAALIQNREELPILATGAAEDKDRLQALVKEARRAGLPIHSLAGETSLGDLGALFSFSRAVVSNDSGPLHIAGGVGAKTVALFGPTDSGKTGPRGKGRTVLIQREKMEDIRPEEVLEALESLGVFQATIQATPRHLFSLHSRYEETPSGQP